MRANLHVSVGTDGATAVICNQLAAFVDEDEGGNTADLWKTRKKVKWALQRKLHGWDAANKPKKLRNKTRFAVLLFIVD